MKYEGNAGSRTALHLLSALALVLFCAACSGSDEGPASTGSASLPSGTTGPSGDPGTTSSSTPGDPGTTSSSTPGDPGTTSSSTPGDPGTTSSSTPGDPGTTSSSSSVEPSVRVGGDVDGLQGDGLVLRLLPADETVTLDFGDDSFRFDTLLATGTAWEVEIATQPQGPLQQICALTGASGTLGEEDVEDVEVTCPIRPWTTKLHHGELFLRTDEQDLELTWPDEGEDWEVWVAPARDADLRAGASAGVQTLEAARSGQRVQDFGVGERTWVALGRGGRVELWSAMERYPMVPALTPAGGFPRPNVIAQAHDPQSGLRFAGGRFTHLRPRAGSLHVLPLLAEGTAQPLPMPLVAGEVLAAESDGEGGWFVVGDFGVLGEDVVQLAHLDRSGAFSDWSLPIASSTELTALLFLDDVLYVGGDFDVFAGQSRQGIAAINREGEILPFDPGVDGEVYDLVLFEEWIVAAGSFETVGSGSTATASGEVARQGLAAFTRQGGVVDWAPGVGGVPLSVAALDGRLYVGGLFDEAWGQDQVEVARDALAAFDVAGSLLDWDPGALGLVTALEIQGGRILVGGALPLVGTGSSHTGGPVTDASVVSVSVEGGVSAFPTPLLEDSLISRIGVSSDRITLAGNLLVEDVDAGGEVEVGALVFDSQGNPVPGFERLCGSPANLALIADGHLLLACSFLDLPDPERHGLQAVLPRTNLAAWDADGRPVPGWDPVVDNLIEYMVVADGKLFIGRNLGDFGMVESASASGGPSGERAHLAAFVAASGSLVDWAPRPNSTVRAMATDGEYVFVGGSFTSMQADGDTLSGAMRLAAFEASSGEYQDWANFGATDTIRLVHANQGTLYIGGDFETIPVGFNVELGVEEFEPRNGLAAFTTTGVVLPWAPDLGASAEVSALASSEGRIFVGGLFSEARGNAEETFRPAYNLAIFDAGGTRLDREVAFGANDAIRTLLVGENLLYMAGEMDAAYEQTPEGSTPVEMPRDRFAVFTMDGGLLPDDPGLSTGTPSLLFDGTQLWIGTGSLSIGGGSTQPGRIRAGVLFSMDAAGRLR